MEETGIREEATSLLMDVSYVPGNTLCVILLYRATMVWILFSAFCVRQLNLIVIK